MTPSIEPTTIPTIIKVVLLSSGKAENKYNFIIRK